MPGCTEIPPALTEFLIQRNAREIASDHKQFQQIVGLPWVAKWVGRLAPLFQEYTVEIEFTPGAADGHLHYPPKPSWVWVTVLEPRLLERDHPPIRIPHLYRYPTEHETPRLCLFWPKEREWTKFTSIANFIIPWTAEWLANYEFWKATGTWPSPEAPHDVVPSNVAGPATGEDGREAHNDEERSAGAYAAGSGILASTALTQMPYYFSNRHPIVIDD